MHLLGWEVTLLIWLDTTFTQIGCVHACKARQYILGNSVIALISGKYFVNQEGFCMKTRLRPKAGKKIEF